MKPKAYIETSVLSYLTALPSRDIVVAAHQQITRDWWSQRDEFDLFVSEPVIAEARLGDPDAANRRLSAIVGLPVLAGTTAVDALATMLLAQAAMPTRAAIDALHVAIATVHGLSFLVTWNCAHIANAKMRPRIETICRSAGFQPPVICTPEELLTQEGT